MKNYDLLKAAVAAALVLGGCSEKENGEKTKANVPPPAYTVAAVPEKPPAHLDRPVVQVEQAKDSGIDFVHETGAAGKKLMPETMGAGCALFDYDGDGRLDALFPDGRPWAGPKAAAQKKSGKRPAANAQNSGHAIARLYHNDGGKFTEVTAKAGLNAVAGYGMGVAAADYDADGDADVVVTTVTGNRLLRNDAGVYVDATKDAGLELGGS